MTGLLVTLGAAAGLAAWLAVFVRALRQPGARDVLKAPPRCFLCERGQVGDVWLCDTHRNRYRSSTAAFAQMGVAFADAAAAMNRVAVAWRLELERDHRAGR